MRDIVVVGSLNMDFVVSVERLPTPGETVLGSGFQMIPGGKGANQACAAGRLSGPGAGVLMVGRIGSDVFGEQLKASLTAAGVDVSAVQAARHEPTGVALIWVEKSGQNSIVVAPGANHAMQASEVGAMRPLFRGAGYVLFQLESPPDTVAAALRLAREEGARTILDPAPAQQLPADILSWVDILTPNETEASILLERAPGRVSKEEAPELARALHQRGPRRVILKLGDRGCLYFDGENMLASPAFRVIPTDTTAAGDTFNAALAVALNEGLEMPAVLRFANASAAISVTRMGAQASIPSRAEVDAFLKTL